MEKPLYPIEDPRKIYPGMRLFRISIRKIAKDDANMIRRIVGEEISYAAIDELKVRSTELNEGETGLIINKDKENIRIQYDKSSQQAEVDGAIYDSEEKASAAAKSINIVNEQKADKFINELKGAKSFLQEVIQKGA